MRVKAPKMTSAQTANLSLRLHTVFSRKVSEKVTQQSQKVGGFEFTVLQRNLKEWHKSEVMDLHVCLRMLKESNKSRFDSFSVWDSALIPYYLSGLSCANFL